MTAAMPLVDKVANYDLPRAVRPTTYADILHARTFVARRKCALGQIFCGYPARTLSGKDKILHFRRVFTARASRRRRFRAIL